ncbi:PQQ-dependent sugar dehydrogenase [Bradyrhizobium sp. SYSU BS000235]|uniref:PQQ-dependent sugar dehydrogenase n=1 Tax=Bradyrhizobium sp. SYSU BS000235 TaxID=3411332 RepID=UPI003C7343E1
MFYAAKFRALSSVAVAAFLCASAVSASAQPSDNLDKLGAFKTTGVTDIPTVPQTGRKVDAIKANLAKVKLPPGFKISLYALVPDARHIAVGPQGVVTFVGTRKNKVYAVTDRGKAGFAEEVKEFAPSVKFTIPNGVCFSKDGVLYIAEQNRVLSFPAAEFFYESPDIAVGQVVPQGELIPKEDESFNHTARVCRIGPDNKLYITLGQPFNVPAKDKLEGFAKAGIGGIIRMDQDGKNREVFAGGIRNSVGMDFNPKNGQLWFTDNQVDGMGDGIPPGELNRITQAGQNFGFPYYGGGKVRTVEYKADTPPANVVYPEVEMDAHAADLGMSFYTGKSFPAKYRGGIFSAQHGSWNRTEPVGARIMFTPLKADGSADKTEVFASGWLTSDGEYLGRPVDVEQLRDGSLLVSDDLAGALYRITYNGK